MLSIDTLAAVFDVGVPAAVKPGVRVIFLSGPTSVPIGSAVLLLPISTTVRLITP